MQGGTRIWICLCFERHERLLTKALIHEKLNLHCWSHYHFEPPGLGACLDQNAILANVLIILVLAVDKLHVLSRPELQRIRGRMGIRTS
jgi:hypothetical protein